MEGIDEKSTWFLLKFADSFPLHMSEFVQNSMREEDGKTVIRVLEMVDFIATSATLFLFNHLWLSQLPNLIIWSGQSLLKSGWETIDVWLFSWRYLSLITRLSNKYFQKGEYAKSGCGSSFKNALMLKILAVLSKNIDSRFPLIKTLAVFVRPARNTAMQFGVQVSN